MKSWIVSLFSVLLIGLLFSEAALAQTTIVTRPREKRVRAVWSATFFDDTPMNGPSATDTSSAQWVGDIYFPSMTLFYKVDDNVGGGDSADISIATQVYLEETGWVRQDHEMPIHVNDIIWQILHDVAPPRVVSAAVTDPAVGQSFLYTAGVEKDWIVNCISFRLTTSAVAGNRYVAGQITDSSNEVLGRFGSNTAQTASTVIRYQFYPGAQDVNYSNLSLRQGPIPPNLYMRFGSTIQSVISNMDALDSIDEIAISTVRDKDPALSYHLPVMADSIRFIASSNTGNGSDVDLHLSVTAMYW